MRYTLLLSLAACGEAPAPLVRINELLGMNVAGLEDERGTPEDWLELVNLGEEAVDLSGWGLTDAFGVVDPWLVPDGTVLEAGGHLVITCDAQPNQGPLHADFQVGSEYGNDIVLLDAEGAWADEVRTGSLFPDTSWARYPDGSDDWLHSLAPTPGAPNGP